ncbi:hypothetical protein [Noviherbaspirillum agri]
MTRKQAPEFLGESALLEKTQVGIVAENPRCASMKSPIAGKYWLNSQGGSNTHVGYIHRHDKK